MTPDSIVAIACPFCEELMKDFAFVGIVPGYQVGQDDLPKIQEAFRYAHGCVWAMDELLGRNTRHRQIQRMLDNQDTSKVAELLAGMETTLENIVQMGSHG